jgi:hypothetical protein
VSEIVIPIAFWTTILFPIGVFVWQIRRIRRDTLSRGRVVTSFFLTAMTPVVLYILVFFLAVAVEEIAAIPIVVEGYARSLLPVLAIGITWVLLMTGALSVLVMFMGRKRS